ncbi:MAG: hypothetical protein K2N70_07770, partial [Helicobacter sp.]|nr:hypothetical protein [Helicobacter sp.]
RGLNCVRPLLHDSNRKCLAFATRLSPCAKRCLTIPQTPARFLKVCAPHGLCQYSTALRLCYALRLEHRRCALWLGYSHGEQWQRDVSASPQHDKIPCVIASASEAINDIG